MGIIGSQKYCIILQDVRRYATAGLNRLMIRKLIVVLLLGISLCSTSSAQRSRCLKYEPEVVELNGTIHRQTFPGRPNYESIKEGDEPETYWILKSKKAICVRADSSDDGNESEANVTRIQLVLDQRQYVIYKSMLGKKVTVKGTLFHSISGHHHTKVLLTVLEIRRPG